MESKGPQPPQRPLRSRFRENAFLRYSSLSVQMGTTIFLGVWGGRQLDKLAGLHFPLWTLLFSLLAVAVAIYQVIRELGRR